jgi:hypothetical protein
MIQYDPNEKVMEHVGSEVNEVNTSMCANGENFNKTGEVSCVYVIGVIGTENYMTHYSVLVKVLEKLNHIILKEGRPITEEILETTPKYFMFSINDP